VGKPRAAKPVPAPKKGPGRPPKSDFDKAMDRARAEYLRFALDKAAEVMSAHWAARGLAISKRSWRALLLKGFAAGQFKSVDTIRDMMKPERRVLRTKRRRGSA